MSGGMTVAALKNASIGIDEFRSMVNYVNTTNKGSVRAIAGANGQVRLEKINNKISFAPHFTNLSAEHNKALRGRMVAALYGDLQYMPKAARQSILKAITKCSDDAFDNNGYLRDDTTVSTGRLLRTEIREVLRQYDEQYNTPQGRKGIVNRMCIDLVKDFIVLTGIEEEDAAAAKKYIKENLKLDVSDLFNPTKFEGAEIANVDRHFNNILDDAQVAGDGDVGAFTVPMADAASFRLVLAAAKRKIGEAVAAHGAFNEIYNTLAQNLIQRGELFDYTLNTELEPGSADYDLFTNLFNKLGADKLNFGGLSENDRALLNAHASNLIGSPKTIQTYIRYVLGNRLADIMNKVDPAKLKHLKELVAEKNLTELKNELESTLDLYHNIVSDALSFCSKFRKFKDDWLNQDIFLKTDGSDMKAKMEGKTGELLVANNMGKKMATTILAEIEKSGDFTFSKAEKDALKNDINDERWVNLFIALERHYASVYNLEQFEIDNGKAVKQEIKNVWDERSREIMTACVEQAKNGGVGTLANDIQDIVDAEIKKALLNKQVPTNSPNFRTAYELVYTYVMAGMCNDKATLIKMLSDKTSGAMARAALLIANVTGMVTRLLDNADTKGQKELAQLDDSLTKLVNRGKLKAEDAKKLLSQFATDCKSQISESLKTFLSCVRINPDDSLVKVLSQGRKREFGDWLLDLLGLNTYEKDELTPKLEELFNGAIRQAKLNAQYATIQAQIQDSIGVKHEVNQENIKKEDLNVANWTNRALAKVKIDDSFLSTLFATQDDYRKTVIGNWMNKAFKQFFCNAMKNNKLFVQTAISTSIDRGALVKAMAQFDANAVKAFEKFNTFQASVLNDVKKMMAETLKDDILKSNPKATAAEIEDLVKVLITDAFVSGRDTICREFEQVLVDGGETFPKSGNESFNDMVDRIALGILSKANASLQARGQKVLSAIEAPAFRATSIDDAVKTLLANPQCAKLVAGLSKEDAERAVRAVVAPNLKNVLDDIRRLPAALTLGPGNSVEEKLAAYVHGRLTDANQLARLEKFVSFRTKFEGFLGTPEGQALNNPETMLGAHFNLICEEVIFEDLPMMLDQATSDTVVGLLKAKTASRVSDIASKLDNAVSQFVKKFNSDDGWFKDDLAHRLNIMIDKVLLGSDVEGVHRLIDRFANRFPVLESLIDNSTFRLLAGTDSISHEGILRRNVFTTLVKVMIDDFIDIQKQVLFDNEVSGMNLREAELSGRDDPKLEIKFYETVDKMLNEMTDDELFDRLNDMLEGGLRKADKFLDETLSVDGLLSNFAERLEQVPVETEGTKGLTAEMKDLLMGDVRAAIKLNVQNRNQRAQATQAIAAIVLREEIANLSSELRLRTAEDETRLANAQVELELAEKGLLSEEEANLLASDPYAKAMFVLQSELSKLEAAQPQNSKAIQAKRQEIDECRKRLVDTAEILERFNAAAGIVECDMLKRIESFIDDTTQGSDEAYMKFADIKAKSVNLAFDLWTGNVSELDEKNSDFATIKQYRESLQDKLIERLATDLRVDDFSANINLVMGYVRDQLTFKNISHDMADGVANIVAEQLKAIGDAASGSIGDLLNQEFVKCLDGVTRLSDLRTRIDDLLWLAGQQLLATKFGSIMDSPMIAGLAARLTEESNKQVGWMDDHGIKSRSGQKLETKLQQQFADEVKIIVNVAVAEVLGLKTERNAESNTFDDTRRNFILMLSDPVAFEQVCRKKISEKLNEHLEKTQGKLDVLAVTEQVSRVCFPEIIRSILPIHLTAGNLEDWLETAEPDEINRHNDWMKNLLEGTITPGKATSITIDNATRDFAKEKPDMTDIFSHDWALFFALQIKNEYGIDLYDGKHDSEFALLESCVGTLKTLGEILRDNLNAHKAKYGSCCENDDMCKYVRDAILLLITTDSAETKKSYPMSIASADGKRVTSDDFKQVREGLKKLVVEINRKAVEPKPEGKGAAKPKSTKMGDLFKEMSK